MVSGEGCFDEYSSGLLARLDVSGFELDQFQATIFLRFSDIAACITSLFQISQGMFNMSNDLGYPGSLTNSYFRRPEFNDFTGV